MRLGGPLSQQATSGEGGWSSRGRGGRADFHYILKGWCTQLLHHHFMLYVRLVFAPPPRPHRRRTSRVACWRRASWMCSLWRQVLVCARGVAGCQCCAPEAPPKRRAAEPSGRGVDRIRGSTRPHASGAERQFGLHVGRAFLHKSMLVIGCRVRVLRSPSLSAVVCPPYGTSACSCAMQTSSCWPKMCICSCGLVRPRRRCRRALLPPGIGNRIAGCHRILVCRGIGARFVVIPVLAGPTCGICGPLVLRVAALLAVSALLPPSQPGQIPTARRFSV